MSYYPFAPSRGAKYVLTGPQGVRAVFNDTTDPDYVATLTEITGLDSPDIREVGDDLVQQDGGQHGDFWLSRRPITITASIFNNPSIQARDLKMDKLMRASMALRADSTLSWRPNTRNDNFIANPKAIFGTSGHSLSTGVAPAQISTNVPVGYTNAFEYSAAGSGTSQTFYVGLTGNGTGQAGAQVIPGHVYSANMLINPATAVGTTWTSLLAQIRWYDATGAQISDSPSTAIYTPNPGSYYKLAIANQVAPAKAAYASIKVTANWATQPTNWTIRYTAVRLNEGTDTTYIDGDTPGWYWQGTPGASASGDYIEMYTPVRRQQPLRYTGGWNKDVQLQLVSEWAALFSSQQSSVTGSGISLENRGSFYAAPKFRITGPSTNPTVTVTGAGTGVLKTTGLTIASGAYVDFDMFSHTAISNTGTSMNRYIDFTNITTWPVFNTGLNTVVLGGGGTLTTFWRDAWA